MCGKRSHWMNVGEAIAFGGCDEGDRYLVDMGAIAFCGCEDEDDRCGGLEGGNRYLGDVVRAIAVGGNSPLGRLRQRTFIWAGAIASTG